MNIKEIAYELEGTYIAVKSAWDCAQVVNKDLAEQVSMLPAAEDCEDYIKKVDLRNTIVGDYLTNMGGSLEKLLILVSALLKEAASD